MHAAGQEHARQSPLSLYSDAEFEVPMASELELLVPPICGAALVFRGPDGAERTLPRLVGEVLTLTRADRAERRYRLVSE